MLHHQNNRRLLPGVISAIVVFIILGGTLIYVLEKLNSVSNKVTILSADLSSTNEKLTTNSNQFSKKFSDLTNQTAGLFNNINNTQRNIDDVKNKVGGVEQTVGSISGTVSNLQKLAEVDPQLLKKYSKVYFLNENYTPAHLTTLPQEYIYSSTSQEQFLSESWPYLQDLLNAAKANGITLYVKSGFRSFAEQKSLKSTYSVVYGAGTANSFSADQGYSEHQLGTTLDFMTTGLGGQLTTSFDKTEAYLWLMNNAYRFGFELSYPKDNKYYVYEPWHWRFVGIKLATYLHDNRLNFYDMDQRDIDKYLINLFDN